MSFTMNYPSKRVVESGENTYIAVSPVPDAAYTDPVWRVMRTDAAGSTDFADGDTEFDNTCDDMPSLTYPARS